MGEPDAITLKMPDGEMELAVISVARGGGSQSWRKGKSLAQMAMERLYSM